MAPVPRLTANDLINLAVEKPDTPMHVGAVLVLDGRCLRNSSGALDLAAVRARIERRLAAAPVLRRRLHRPGPLAGRPLWVDDAAFRIERHVTEVAIEPPADEAALLRLAEELLTPLLGRDHPLWRIWFVTGLSDGRIALVVALHHAIADGLAAIRLLTALLDEPAASQTRMDSSPWVAQRPPAWRGLVVDNVRSRLAGGRRVVRHLRPGRWAPRLRRSWRVFVHAWGAPRTTLNTPVGSGRVLALLRLDLAAVKHVAHSRGATVNDVVLDLAGGGVRALLRSRGEATDDLTVHAALAVSQRPPEYRDEIGNLAGVVVVRLPLAGADPLARLDGVRTETASVKREQLASAEQHAMVWLARSGLMRYATRHQHLTNIVVSNMIGPDHRIAVLGSPVLDLVPVGALAGNLALSFLAFSYDGRLIITVLADAGHCTDLDVLIDAMARDWQALLGCDVGT